MCHHTINTNCYHPLFITVAKVESVCHPASGLWGTVLSQIHLVFIPARFHAGLWHPVESARSESPLKDPNHKLSSLIVIISPTRYNSMSLCNASSIFINSVQLDACQCFEKNKSYKYQNRIQKRECKSNSFIPNWPIGVLEYSLLWSFGWETHS